MRTVLVLLLATGIAGAQVQIPVKPSPTKPEPSPVPQSLPPQQLLPAKVDPNQFAAAAAEWFPELTQSLEVQSGATEIKGVFAFRNPRAEPFAFHQLLGNCSCARAVVVVGDRRFELQPKPPQLFEVISGSGKEQRRPIESIPIAAGQEGQVEVYVDPNTMKGPKLVSLDVHTTDPKLPMARLQLNANYHAALLVTPQEVVLGTMANGEARDFTVQVMSSHKEFEITGGGPFQTGVTATWAKEQQKGEQVYWTIRGRLQPEAVGDIHANLEFKTNLAVAPTFSLRVHATVSKAVEVTPSLLLLGMVRAGVGGAGKVTFAAADGKTLHAKAMRLEKLSLPEQHFTLRQSEEGGKLVVEILVDDHAPKGLIRGDLVVTLDRPGIKDQRVLFNGFVR